MTPYYHDSWLTVYGGDCREVMQSLEPESVHCVVTSPPYWGLRDYGTATWIGGDAGCEHVERNARGDAGRPATMVPRGVGGAMVPSGSSTPVESPMQYRHTCGKCGARRLDSQLGLEATPEEFVANMVDVFREVRRVLRADGTCWLNLGSSYAAAGGTDPSQSRRQKRAPAYGSDGTEPSGSSALGSAYPDLCDGCRAGPSSRTPGTLRPLPDAGPPPSLTARGTEPEGSGPSLLGASPPAAPASTTPRSSTPQPGRCSHCGNCGACLSVLRSSSLDARECVRRSWLNYPTFKQKDLVPIPWLVALALQADGWYLRRDVIWNKPNPMPESVTDRPTSSHEYLFLLSKSARYFYDIDAVREPFIYPADATRQFKPDGWATNGGPHTSVAHHADRDGKEPTAVGAASDKTGRNLRSVWTIATQPYPGAHFATFPRKLVEPCIKAGCPHDGVVLDPFAGSGTTGAVAQALGRRAILIDLNPDYLKQAMIRNRDVPLGLVG